MKAGKGGGVTHPTHMQRFGIPGKTMVGFDSHTPAAGSVGMLAIGVGGTEVAPAVAGEPLYIRMPEIWGVKLTGQLPPWTRAKDVILEMLRRHGVKGGVSRIVEYYDPGLAAPTAMDRHVIANMGAELGATTTVFPADDQVRTFLRAKQRERDLAELLADEDATYDVMRSATRARSERKSADQGLLVLRVVYVILIAQCWRGTLRSC
ncbi:aconitase family protein [Cryobacterium sp. Hh11]|uniref:aconitase family protein n=1 Tax=Cryobacterium sp. Hh11 TaxID=2555868 RepID=UPI001F5405FC|nr:aconitase family protein [Cryobacterium sp. Hh11]